jgi:putative protease
VYGAVPDEARTAPISEDLLRRNLSKLGGTVYSLLRLDIELDEGLILPISAINALRREAIEKISEKTKSASSRTEADFIEAKKSLPAKKRENIRSAVFYQPEKIPADAKDYFNYIYIPLEKYQNYSGSGYGVMLPEVIFDSERDTVEKLLQNAYDNGARDALIGNIGHIELAKKYGFKLHGDLRLNAFNNSSVAELEKMGFEDVILSPELTLRQIRDIGGATAVCVYGRLPLMITEKCVGRELGSCENCEAGNARLTDRRAVDFPVLKRFGHRSAIFNSVPTYMADRRIELENAGIVAEHFIFTVESSAEISKIVNNFEKRCAFDGACRRIK